MIVSILILLVAVSLFVPGKSQNADTPAAPADENNAEPENAAPNGSDTQNTGNLYVPGVYSSMLQLGSSNVELQVTVDKDHINAISFVNVDEAVATMYPLMEPTLSGLAEEILAEQSLEDISYTEENRYTSLLLMQAISASLDKASVSENADSNADTLSTDALQ
ncbi:MAG: hypothetical protein NC337_08145 [Roseburia sp.]|nr:hypothetical protein [Roseburia sp.]